jgi:hypothetical protein
MNRQNTDGTKPATRDAVQPRARTRSVRSALLSWTDTDSEARLTVEVSGSERFLQELERLGFEEERARRGVRPPDRSRRRNAS